MQKIVFITDPEVLAIPIEDCSEKMIDVKKRNVLAFGPPPECEATQNDYTKMRKTVFEKLCAVQDSLPHGYRLRLYEGYRSLSVQKMLFDNEYARVAVRYPNESPAFLFHETTRLVSPVINFDGSINTPAHNTGAAVDVEIIDKNGDLVDMGMACKDWIDVNPDLCLTHYQDISEHAKANRQLLLDVMHAQGFVNYATEWWHFSYGDRYWAFHKKVDKAIYGTADAL